MGIVFYNMSPPTTHFMFQLSLLPCSPQNKVGKCIMQLHTKPQMSSEIAMLQIQWNWWQCSHKLVQKGSRQTSETQVAPPSTPSPHGSQTGGKKQTSKVQQSMRSHCKALAPWSAFRRRISEQLRCVCNIISDKVGSQMLYTAIMPLCFKQSVFFHWLG